ncbi:hypothetical protein DPK85_15180 [Salmonella enterica subsp. diarizonae]|nr:hypothetical protein [Salmonella enterica subsp. diarizonae]
MTDCPYTLISLDEKQIRDIFYLAAYAEVEILLSVWLSVLLMCADDGHNNGFFQLVESTDKRVSPLLTAPAITLVRCSNTNKTTINKGGYCEIHYFVFNASSVSIRWSWWFIMGCNIG